MPAQMTLTTFDWEYVQFEGVRVTSNDATNIHVEN